MRNVIAYFANKWSMLLLVILDEFGVMRFNELSRAIPDISPKVLSGHLKTLESVGLVKRILYAESATSHRIRVDRFGQNSYTHTQSALGMGTGASERFSEAFP